MIMPEKQPNETEKQPLRHEPLDYQDMLMNAPIGVFSTTPEGRFIYANLTLARLFGYDSPQEMKDSTRDVGTQYYADPDDRERIRRLLEEHDEILNFESRFVRRDGSRFWASYNIRAVRDEKGTIDHYQGFFSDITERKQERESLLRTQFAMDRAPDSIIWIDDEGRIVYANDSACASLDYERGELLKMKIFNVDPDFPQERFEQYKEKMRRLGSMSFESRHRTRDGRLFPVEVNTKYFEFDDRFLVCGFDRDITGRKRVEKELREREGVLRSLFEATPVGVALLKDRVFKKVNKALCGITGYTEDEMTGMTTRLLYPDEEEFERIGKELYEKMEKDGLGVKDAVLKRKDGGRINVVLSLSPFNIDDNSAGVCATIQDITGRKLADEALRESERKYRFIIENMSDIVWIANMDLQIVYVTSSVQKVTEFSAEEVMFKTVTELMTPDSRSLALDMMAKVLAREKEEHADPEKNVTLLLEFYHKDGSTRWLETVIRGIRNDQGVLTGLHGVSRDVTERRRIEEKLRFSEEWHRRLMEDAPAGFCIIDRMANIQYVNRIVEEVTGYSRHELVERNAFETGLFSEDSVRMMADRLMMRMAGVIPHPDTVEMPVICRDGKIVWIEMYTRIHIEDGLPAGAQVVMVDITDRKRVEEEREKLKEQLDRAQRLESIGTLAGGVAHDFNNLLMGIQGNAALMMLDLDPSDPHYEQLRHIEEQVRSGADLTRQLLGFAQGGRYTLKPANMNDIIEKTAAMFGRAKKEITIRKNYGKELGTVEVDGTQMGQVFMNLFVNAWQAMPGGGEIFLETENLVLDDEKACALSVSGGKYVRITVTDTGTGMDAKTLERIFDPFFTTKGMGRGTGLGLAMVYGIIKGHGGVINVMSRPGRGTTFRIYLPAAEKSVIAEKVSETKVLGGVETILLVDDEAAVLDVTNKMLQALGYRVYCAASGPEAVAVCNEKKKGIDLVILDMIMPGMSGSETFDSLREINPGQKVLLSSGYSVNDQARELLEKGCNGFLQKPFLLKDLAREVRTALDVKKGLS
jgi:PAS domain S-box-containing protein